MTADTTWRITDASSPVSDLPVVVAGAGLAGLSAALHLARSGQRVILLEQSEHAGGRGFSREAGGWTFNLGAHALYLAGAGRQILTELGVHLTGKTPAVRGVQAFLAGQMQPLSGAWLSPAEKLRLPLLLARLMTLRPLNYRQLSAAQWLDQLVGPQPRPLRHLMGFLVRVSSYAAAHERLSAEVAIQQVQLALRANVLYLDGGWQTLVDQLLALAHRQGVEIRLGCGLQSLSRQQSHWQLGLKTGELQAAGVVLALPPQTIQRLLAPWPELALHRQLAELEPVLAACLDLGLTSLPVPGRLAAFGMDEATYVSVHSASARLAPPGAALIHSLWYLGGEDPPDLRARLESRLDQFQPGWQKRTGPVYYYPHLTVTHALAKPGLGLAGRPPVAVAGLPHLCLAGDWVGETGWLADAALASGRQAARLLPVLQATVPMPAGLPV